MQNKLPFLYWDACVPMSYINGLPDRLPDIEALMMKGGIDFQIITSALSITEVAFAQVEQDNHELDPQQRERIENLWAPGSPIKIVELYPQVAEDARELIRRSVAAGIKVLKPADAIHLATADKMKVSRFHTYDGTLEKYKAITDTHFEIVRPAASQPVLIMGEAQDQNETPAENAAGATGDS